MWIEITSCPKGVILCQSEKKKKTTKPKQTKSPNLPLLKKIISSMSVHLITSLIQGTQSCSPHQSACCKCTIFSQHILPSFLSSFPSTLMLEVVGGIACATLYLDRRKCLNLFALQGQVLHLLLYPCARPAFLLLCAGCFGLSFCSAVLQNGKMPEIWERQSRVCVCVLFSASPQKVCVPFLPNL